MHEQNVPLGAPRHRLVNRAAEQSLEEAAFAAADDDQVGIPLVGVWGKETRFGLAVRGDGRWLRRRCRC